MAAEYSSPGVYVEEGPARASPISGVKTNIAAFVDAFERGPLDRAVLVRAMSEFEGTFGRARLWSPASLGIRLYFENGGREAWVVRVPRRGRGRAGAAALIGRRSADTGLHALDRADSFGLLCLPAAAELPAAVMKRVYSAASRYCEERRALVLMDTGAAVNTARAMHAWLQENEELWHPNVAVYFPRLRVANPMRRGSQLVVAPSGAVAGLIARIEDERGVWKAPAGTDAVLKGVASAAPRLTETDARVLGERDVNCLLQSAAQAGLRVWGARTFGGGRKASEWKYLPTRRLALYIEESLYQATKWTVFEPNDERLWARIRHGIEGFMLGLFREGALAGGISEQAYFVKCGPETMTQDDIDNGIVSIRVGFAPLRPAEFVVFQILQKSA